MKKFTLYLITLIALMTSCKENKGVENPQGKNLLLIGNSFFRPYAEKLNAIALATDFENHNSYPLNYIIFFYHHLLSLIICFLKVNLQ